VFTVVAIAVPARTPLGYALVLLGAYAPAFSALAVTAWHEGRAAIGILLKRILIVDVLVRYYVFAIGYLAAVKLAAALLHRAWLGVWPRFGTESLAGIAVAVAFSTPFQAGEEIGWRGYALPRLAARMGLARASVLLGVIWAIWHVPQFYIRDADAYHQSFPVWSAQVVALSVAFAWLFARTGSLLLVMLLHSAVNNTKDIVPSGLDSAPGVFSVQASAVSRLSLMLLWICAACFLFDMRGGKARATFATEPSPRHDL
jgi:membrane protease YdiL (CAAX protease family)